MNSEAFELIKMSKSNISLLEANESGDVVLYDKKFAKTYNFESDSGTFGTNKS